MPAETFRSSPVIEVALSEARKTAAAATSSTGIRRPSGELLVNCRRASSRLMPFVSACLRITHSMRSPSTPPGETTFTRIPYGPTSQASVLARPTRAILLAEYGVRPNKGLCWLLGTSVLRNAWILRTDVPRNQHSVEWCVTRDIVEEK